MYAVASVIGLLAQSNSPLELTLWTKSAWGVMTFTFLAGLVGLWRWGNEKQKIIDRLREDENSRLREENMRLRNAQNQVK